ncbi:MAG: alkaline phosphatase D family protein [Bacteroidia bacterium]
MYKLPYLFLFWALLPVSLMAQSDLLKSGPMVGYSEMREVAVWVQTAGPADVFLRYWQAEDSMASLRTRRLSTAYEEAFTAVFQIPFLEPGKTYHYALFINRKKISLPYETSFQTQSLWQWRRDQDPPQYTVALGSCTYINDSAYDRPGRTYGNDYQVFTSIHKKDPDMMLWLGDNVYLREADWYSRSGILDRYTHTRSTPEMQPLLASTHHYAIWDDHDYGPNDANRSFIGKEQTLEAFRLFWPNRISGLPGAEGGITSQFQFGDIDYFLLDNRYFRSPNRRTTGQRTILGNAQIEWLIDALKTSRAPFKMVVMGGQFLNTAAVHETYSTFPEERQKLLELIVEEKIPNVVFLTGDRHHTELSKLDTAGITIYDFTVSPLTSGPNTNVTEVNRHREEGTLVQERNFGMLTFSGAFRERQLKMQIFNSEGTLLWERTIAQ